MKFDWKKQERELYSPKNKPQLITVPRQNFITIKGTGNPNGSDFSERVGVLYSVAYPVKMGFKKMCAAGQQPAAGFGDYAVYPLEGVWTSSDPGNPLNKDSFEYTIMIRQPGCISKAMFDEAMASVKKKKPHPFLDELAFDSMEDGKCIQMMHAGSFDDEPASFALMDAFAKEAGLERLGRFHREIYLNDARKTAPEKRKTVLRYQVK